MKKNEYHDHGFVQERGWQRSVWTEQFDDTTVVVVDGPLEPRRNMDITVNWSSRLELQVLSPLLKGVGIRYPTLWLRDCIPFRGMFNKRASR
jgi:hypothetical protein